MSNLTIHRSMSPSSCTLWSGRRRHTQSGFTTMTALMLVALALITVFVMVNVSLTQIRLSARGQNRAIGLTLAEAGIDDALDQLRSDSLYGVNSDHTSRTMTPVYLYDNPNSANPQSQGGYRAQVVWVSRLTRKVVSEALRPDGSSLGVRVVAIVDLVEDSVGKYYTITSNGNVRISGNADIKTDPAGQHVADIWSNANISQSGSSSVDGTLRAVGTITGNGYYANESSQKRKQFPSAAEMEEWRQEWINIAKGGTPTPSTAPAPKNGGTTTTITAPAYINGDLKLGSKDSYVLTAPSGLDPKRKVIYVNGDVDLGSQAELENQGILLVIAGKFHLNGQAVYTVSGEVDDQKNEKPTVVVYGDGYAPGDEVIRMNGGGSATNQGIIFAVNGSIRVNGNADFTGSLVAAGAGSGVDVLGTYDHFFPSNQESPVKTKEDARVRSVIEL